MHCTENVAQLHHDIFLVDEIQFFFFFFYTQAAITFKKMNVAGFLSEAVCLWVTSLTSSGSAV